MLFLRLLSHQPPVFKPRSRGVTGQRVQQWAGLLGDSRLKERSLWYMMLILSPSSRQVVRNKEACCEQGDWWRLGEMRRWWEVGGQRQTWFPTSPLINTMWCPLTVNFVVKKNKCFFFFKYTLLISNSDIQGTILLHVLAFLSDEKLDKQPKAISQLAYAVSIEI